MKAFTRRNKLKNLAAIVVSVLFLSGCCPTYNFSVPNVAPSPQKINADINGLTILYGMPDPDQPIQIIDNLSKEEQSKEIIPAWGIALRDAVKKSDLFDKSAKRKVSLVATILEIDVPFIGFDITTHVVANYKLIDNGTDTTLYDDTVKSKATVQFNYAFRAYTRAIESINRAVQKNISTFITNIKNHNPLIPNIK